MLSWPGDPCKEEAWLALAGAGLGPHHITRGLLDLAACADIVLVDTYTMPGTEWILDELSLRHPGKVRAAARRDLEDGAGDLARKALAQRVLVVVPGDPLIATTHRSLLVTAARQGARAIALPGVSGVCAAKAMIGLDYYKYGRTLTLPGPWRMVRPYSVLEALAWNLCTGAHTLLLLDIEPGTGRQLHPCEGLQGLADIEDEAGIRILDRAEIVLVERAGMTGGAARRLNGAREACELAAIRPPASLIVPGRVAPYEAEAAQLLVTGRIRGNQAIQGDACRLAEALRE